MNKKITVAFLAVLLLLCSCQTAPIVWDDSYPEEKMATVRLIGMKIDSYNGVSVSKFNWVKIPAGETRLGGEVSISHASFTFQLSGMEFTCLLEGGKEYIIQGRSEDMQWGVSVYEAAQYSQITLENRVAFIPFKNQPKFN